MRVKVICMRDRGVAIPQRMLRDRYTVKRFGELVIMDTTDQGLRRQVKVARISIDLPHYTMELVEPHILWVTGSNFVLTGFERGTNDKGEAVDFAQSWLCSVEAPKADSEEEIGSREGKRLARASRS